MILRAIAVAAATLFIVPALASAQPTEECPFSLENRRPEIPYRPFPLKHPATGEDLHPNEMITFDRNGETVTMVAWEYFAELNELEKKLNKWGYTMREDGEFWLGQIDACEALLKEQQKTIDKTLSKEKSLLDIDGHIEEMEQKYEDYKAKIPDWDTLMEKADDESVKVYLPPAPTFAATPTLPRLDAPPLMNKERTWSFEVGDKSKILAAGEAGFSVKASKLGAEGHAHGSVRAGLFNVWEDEVLGVSVDGEANNSKNLAKPDDAVRLAADVRVIGKSVWSDEWKAKELRKDKTPFSFTVDKAVTYRFSIGPVPCSARIGFNGGLGLKMGVVLVPIQVGAYAVPYAKAKAYIQVGVDLVVAGAGAGADLTLVDEEFVITGTAGVSLGDEVKLVLELLGTNELDTLSGRMYAYAFIDYFIKRKQWDWTLFEWEGFKSKAEAFRFRTEWSPSGVIIEGDATKEDVALANQQNALLDVVQLEGESQKQLHEIMTSMRNAVTEQKTLDLLQTDKALASVDGSIKQAIDQYWVEARKWGAAN